LPGHDSLEIHIGEVVENAGPDGTRIDRFTAATRRMANDHRIPEIPQLARREEALDLTEDVGQHGASPSAPPEDVQDLHPAKSLLLQES
jgi:hypothetical protein